MTRPYLCFLYDSATHVSSIVSVHAEEDGLAIAQSNAIFAGSTNAIGFEVLRKGQIIERQFMREARVPR